MKFAEHRDPSILTVRSYQTGGVKINDLTLQNSCYLNQTTLIQNWQCESIEELNENHLDSVMQLKPEVLILGTGETQVFPEPRLFAYCAQRGIGLEVMDNAAACRTYNVLTTEERPVVLALIIKPSAN